MSKIIRTGVRECTKCGKTLPESEFYMNGTDSYCKPCRREKSRLDRLAKKERPKRTPKLIMGTLIRNMLFPHSNKIDTEITKTQAFMKVVYPNPEVMIKDLSNLVTSGLSFKVNRNILMVEVECSK